MPLKKLLKRLNPLKSRADKAREQLKANAEKALRMKQEADAGAHIPPHRTPREGMHAKMGQAGSAQARETDFTTQMGRSSGPRTGDAS